MAKASLPERIQALLIQADKRNRLPAGTMASIMQQEVGGKANQYLQDPAKYHYGLNAEGRRVAGHTGKVSTAFGPFGILESTGAKPGYGVKPLANKTIEEQVRFASEYLAARSKGKGLAEGLAGYGEGRKYANQVAGRLPGRGGMQPLPINAATVQSPGLARFAPERLAQLTPESAPLQSNVQIPQQAAAQQVIVQPAPPPVQRVAPVAAREWTEFQQAVPVPVAQTMDMDYGAQPQQVAAFRGTGSYEAENAQRMHSILKKFGLGTYSQGPDERYQASLPEFARG